MNDSTKPNPAGTSTKPSTPGIQLPVESTSKLKDNKRGKRRRRKRSGSPEQRTKRPFPKVSLAKALEIPNKIRELNGGNPWSSALVAESLGMSAKTPDFFYLCAGSRDYGLTTGTNPAGEIGLTEFGREVVYAPNPEAEMVKKREAFNKVQLFEKVLKYYNGSDLPEMKYLANTLEREFGLPAKYHEEFSQIFRENCKYLSITKGQSGTASGGNGKPTSVTVGEPAKASQIKAFVIMPFTEKSDRPQGFFTEVLRSLITPGAIAAGFNVATANRQGSDLIQSTIINELLDADLVIADLTDHNPNVFLELGLRLAVEKPIALIKAAGTGRVFDVDNMLRVYEYQPMLWRSTLDTDVPEFTKHIKAAWENRQKDHSYMSILRRSIAKETNQQN